MLFLKHQKLSDQELIELAQTFSQKEGGILDKILHWDFGPIMNMKFDSDAKNYLFSAQKVPLHWDGAFYKTPRKLLFYCTETQGIGGETFFVDTTAVWESLTDRERELCSQVNLRYETSKLAHYGGSFECGLVETHPETGQSIIRLAEKVDTNLNPVKLTISGIERPWEFYEWLVNKFYSPPFLYEHHWDVGDVLVVDNYRYLHGRRELLENKKRTFKRIQIL